MYWPTLATRVNDDTHLNNNVVIFSHHQGQKKLENAQDFFVKTKIKTKTFISRPRPRLVFLSSRRLKTKTLVSRTTSLSGMRKLYDLLLIDNSIMHYTNDRQATIFSNLQCDRQPASISNSNTARVIHRLHSHGKQPPMTLKNLLNRMLK